MSLAVTRQVSPRFAECELTYLERIPIDLELARRQHHEYTQALESLGCQLIELPAEPGFPDSVFVEDTAIILPEVAVITRPGAESRRGEVQTIGNTLGQYRELVFIQEPATIDGGDVLVMDNDIYVGLSTRSGLAAIQQLQDRLEPFGYNVIGLPFDGCLHLKSAATRINEETILINPLWVNTPELGRYRHVEVDAFEPSAANILMIGQKGIYPSAFPRTCEILSRRGIELNLVDISEIAKAEGAVTCCSLIL